MSKFAKCSSPNTLTATLSLASLLSMGASQSAMAACVGSVNPLVQAQPGVTVECGVATPTTTFPMAPSSPASDGNLTIAPGDVTTYKDTSVVGVGGTAPAPYNGTAAAVTNTTVQFDGHGRTLTVGAGAVLSNERVINGTTGTRGRNAVLMGAATQNESATTTFNASSPPTVGTTVVTLNTVTPAASWVGQSMVFGRFDAGQGDFYPGTALVITAVNPATKQVTLSGPLPAGFEGTGSSSLPLVFNVTSNYGQGTTIDGVFYNNVVDNAGTISAKIGTAEILAGKNTTTNASVSNTGAVKAITSSVAGDYLVDNKATGKIQVTHDGIGNAFGVEGGGAVTSITVNNAGLIQSTRTGTVTITNGSVTAASNGTATTSNLPGVAAAALGQANAINNQEELEAFTLNNSALGVIRATGDYSAAVVTRAGEDTITNAGLIEHINSAGGFDKGYAIGANSNAGEIRDMTLNNSGTINGDILAVNGASLRWYLLSTEATLAPNGTNDRLNITSQHGQFNSETLNSGVIKGNLWYANGAHELENTGAITGNIDVEQRDTQNQTAAGVGTLTLLKDENGNATNNTQQGTQFVYRGEKKFDFTNEGTLTGNINVANATSTITGATFGTGTVDKTISSSNTITNEDGATITGNITIKDVAGATNTINLEGDGFTGDIAATTGAGTNTLNLSGEGTLRGDVSKFTEINVEADTGGASADWTIAASKTAEAASATVDDGSLTVIGTLKANTTVEADGILKGTGLVTGNVANNGTIDVADSKLDVVGNVDLNSGSTLVSTISGPSANGVLNVSGAAIAATGFELALKLQGYQPKDGDAFTVIKTTAGFSGEALVEGTALIDWEQQIVGGNDLVLTADVSTAGITGLSAPGDAALNAVIAFDNTLGNDILGLANADDVRKAAEQLAPETNFATQQAALAITQASGRLIDRRLSGSGATGTSIDAPSGLGMKPGSEGRMNLSGNDGYDGAARPASSALWGEALAADLNQNQRSNVDGYDARIFGAMVGYDNWIASNARLGVAVGYANSSIAGEGDTAANRTDMDSYLVQLYGSLKGWGWHLTGQTGYTWHNFDTSRSLTIPTVDTATASHDGDQFNVSAELGAPIQSGTSFVITPFASLAYSRLQQDGYTETSSGGMALIVDDQDTNSLVSSLGVKFETAFSGGSVLQGRAAWLHEFSDAAQSVSASFAAGGGTFTAAGPDVGRDSVLLGVGLLGEVTPGSTLQLNYDANVREQFISHVGSVRLTVGF